MMYGIQNLNASLLKIGPDTAAFPSFKKFLQALIGERPNHRTSPLAAAVQLTNCRCVLCLPKSRLAVLVTVKSI